MIETSADTNAPNPILPTPVGEDGVLHPDEGSVGRQPEQQKQETRHTMSKTKDDRDARRVGPEDESRESQIAGDDRSEAGTQPKTPGDMEPANKRGRTDAKTDGNPNVTGDVRTG